MNNFIDSVIYKEHEAKYKYKPAGAGRAAPTRDA